MQISTKIILESYKQALATAHLLNSAQLSTALIESDFAFAISKYCAHVRLWNGLEVLIRPILPVDIDRMKESVFHVLSNGEVSQESLSLRFNAVTNVVKDDMLRYFTNIDYDSHFAFAALIKEGSTWKGVATARIIQDKDDSSVAEWAAIVLDAYHGMGIGSCLLYCLSCMASHFDIRRLCAVVHHENYPVLHWMKKASAYQEFYRDCRFWMFETPLNKTWIPSDEVRERLERAAHGKGGVEDECMQELQRTVKKIDQERFLNGCRRTVEETGMKETMSGKRNAPVVSFVTSGQDDFDIGDLF
ncbi:uncharacterized protein [Blastocystis hominis]|uniref:N-acetyltransferase domain-containing protein n=1 Tax=Blastocystis hominis TaxID=12968 RepID=D8MAZ5_BLAHO|nr:uncharacterized protein [Blastocystis hominis]CBK25234.2 unnamed protein product [Blastocystis hominis]|eukprot:XP_012899282.1 uncharacterized protein [Blastocystis hominis]